MPCDKCCKTYGCEHPAINNNVCSFEKKPKFEPLCPVVPRDFMYRRMDRGSVPNDYTIDNRIVKVFQFQTSAFRSRTGICPLGWYSGSDNMCYPMEPESEGMFYK